MNADSSPGGRAPFGYSGTISTCVCVQRSLCVRVCVSALLCVCVFASACSFEAADLHVPWSCRQPFIFYSFCHLWPKQASLASALVKNRARPRDMRRDAAQTACCITIRRRRRFPPQEWSSLVASGLCHCFLAAETNVVIPTDPAPVGMRYLQQLVGRTRFTEAPLLLFTLWEIREASKQSEHLQRLSTAPAASRRKVGYSQQKRCSRAALPLCTAASL